MNRSFILQQFVFRLDTFIRGGGGGGGGDGGWNSAGWKVEEGEFWQGNRLGVWEAMVRKGTAERLEKFN